MRLFPTSLNRLTTFTRPALAAAVAALPTVETTLETVERAVEAATDAIGAAQPRHRSMQRRTVVTIAAVGVAAAAATAAYIWWKRQDRDLTPDIEESVAPSGFGAYTPPAPVTTEAAEAAPVAQYAPATPTAAPRPSVASPASIPTSDARFAIPGRASSTLPAPQSALP